MKKINLSLFFIFTISILFSQTKKIETESVADCSGAMNIFKSGSYTLQFTGTGGKYAELGSYPSLSEISDENLIWVSFIAQNDGVLKFDASINQDFLQMVVFEEISNICLELSKGSAEVKRLYKQKDQKSLGLDTLVSKNKMYPISLSEGQKVVIAFATLEKSKAFVKLNFEFKENKVAQRAANESKVIDSRNDDFSPALTISIRDKETNLPIIANITIEGTKDLTALYTASDLMFNIMRSAKIILKCDAEGYFFVDKEINVSAATKQEIIITMERVSKGKSMQIEEIEFVAGTSEFMTGSELKLRRLKDFMALNADIHIEIQGHVFSIGNNGVAEQKLSEARAKRVMQYLINNGISKDRMVAIGYGNTKPIYAKPKLAYEEQMNRRVEILIK